MAKLINESVELEETGEVENKANHDAAVEGPHGGAVVIELLSTKVRQSLALAVHSRHQHIEGHLRESEEPVNLPGLVVGVRFRPDEIPHVLQELPPALACSARRELAVVEDGTNPHVVHECGEADHHGTHSQCSSKLLFALLVSRGKVLLCLKLPVIRACIGLAAVPVRCAIGVAVCVTIRMPVALEVVAGLGVGASDFHKVVRLRRRLVGAIDIGEN